MGSVGRGGSWKTYLLVVVELLQSWVSVARRVSFAAFLSSSTVVNALAREWATDSARMAAFVASIDSVPDCSAGGNRARMPRTPRTMTVSYTHLRAHETGRNLV